MFDRQVPEVPPPGESLRLLIDTDAANEIDDLYAIALALHAPDRFRLEGLVATHFGQQGERGGPHTIQQSYDLIQELLASGTHADVRVERGGDPMRYITEPSDSPGARFIIERALAGPVEDPLWLVALGAATNVASALLLEPSIAERIRLVFHARSEWSWPQRSEQFNVSGDVPAVRAILIPAVPLVWFDTGQQLTCPMAATERLLALGGPPGFLHEFRLRHPGFQRDDKGFFDLGDIAWLMQPDVCTSEVVDVPHMDAAMRFQHRGDLGQMRRVHSALREPVWELFFSRMGL